jgi:hypothetical protein
MRVEIVPVRCAEGGPAQPVEFELPCLARARRLARECLLRHPFVSARGGELRRDLSAATVRIEVAVADGPRSREYACARLGAEIRYDPYMAGPEGRVDLLLHLRCYMGEPVEPRPREGSPPAEVLAAREFDAAGLRRTLWHEYGHMIDALRPGFGYDLVVKRWLSAYGRAVVNELWNAYIDRRLREAVSEADQRFFAPLGAHTRTSLEMMLRGIWADGRDWTYRELVRAALDIPPR